MIPHEHLEAILAAAVAAPSADNAQPWKFTAVGDDITLLHVPEADKSLDNIVQNASTVSHGCLLENIRLVAAQFGYHPDIRLAEDPQDKVVAQIHLTHGTSDADDLYECVALRSSNRKPYSTDPLTDAEIKYLFDEHTFPPGIRVLLKAGQEKDALATASSVNEKVVLENRLLHAFLFDHVTWSKAEDEASPGFYIDTFELQGPQKIAFRLFSHWRILQLFNRIGASDFISRDNAALYKKSAAIGAIIAEETTRTGYINAGVALQRIWLRATKLGLGFQPLTGVTLLMQRIREEGGTGLSEQHIALIHSTYRQIENICGDPEGKILMLFRIGHADPPSARTRRKPLLIER